MRESSVGRTATQAITRFVLRLAVLSLVTAIALFASGRDAAALGVLVCPLLAGSLALRIKQTIRSRDSTIDPMPGMTFWFILRAMPGVVVVVVALLIGGDVIVFIGTAMGTSLIAMSALF